MPSEPRLTPSADEDEVANRSAALGRRRTRLLLSVSAVVVVVVVVVVGVVGLVGTRSDQEHAASSVGHVGDLRVELWVSDTEPAPDGVLSARLTVTNTGNDPVPVRAACLSLVPGNDSTGTSGRGSPEAPSVAWSPSPPLQESTVPQRSEPDPGEPDRPSRPDQPSTADRALLAHRYEAAFTAPGERHCTVEAQGGETADVLGPGEASSSEGELDLAISGLPAGRGRLVGQLQFTAVITNALLEGSQMPEIDVTIPPAPEGVVTRAAAVDTVHQHTEFRQWARAIGDRLPSSTVDPVGDGWHVSLWTSEGDRFEATVDPTGARVDVRQPGA